MARSTRALLIPFDFILRVLLNDGVKVGGISTARVERAMKLAARKFLGWLRYLTT